MLRSEQEVVPVLNAADTDVGFVLVSSTWPRWTRFLDKLVAEELGTCQDIRDADGRRLGGCYRINAGVLTLARKRTRKMTPEQAEAARERARNLRNRRSQNVPDPSSAGRMARGAEAAKPKRKGAPEVRLPKILSPATARRGAREIP